MTNDFHKPTVDRIRAGMKVIYGDTFDFKAGFLWPVDWRPREFNKPPDALCNTAMNESKSICLEPDWDELAQKISNGACLQVHCDGGYRNSEGIGGAAFVVHLVDPNTSILYRIAYEAQFLHIITSSFQAECIALDMAVSFVLAISSRGARGLVAKRRRVPFVH